VASYLLVFCSSLSESDVKTLKPSWGVNDLRSQAAQGRGAATTLLGGFSTGTGLSILKFLISGKAMNLFLCGNHISLKTRKGFVLKQSNLSA